MVSPTSVLAWKSQSLSMEWIAKYYQAGQKMNFTHLRTVVIFKWFLQMFACCISSCSVRIRFMHKVSSLGLTLRNHNEGQGDNNNWHATNLAIADAVKLHSKQ